MQGRVLIIAGSDSSGGAGIQADIKTVTALGGFATSAITALTAQDTQSVSGIHDVPPEFIAEQIRIVLQDIGADCIKTGMLHLSAVIDAVCDTLAKEAPGIPVVVDPVMVAKGGAQLLACEAMEALKSRMVPAATVLTPNLPEAETLAGFTEVSVEEASKVVAALKDLGAKNILLKGGHREGAEVIDFLLSADGVEETFSSPRIDTTNTHGTGCTLASAIAAGIAQGMIVRDAVARARNYVMEAIRTAPGYGAGHGPLNHGHTVAPFN